VSTEATGDAAAELAALATRVSAGDRDAEGELLERIQTGVLAIAIVRLRDRDAARDAAQDALVALIEALRAGRLNEASKVAAFAHGIVVNIVRNRRRSALVRPEMQSLEPGDAVVLPDDPLVSAEAQAMLRDGMAELEAVDRRILGLTLSEGLTPGAIAARLGMSAELVRTRKSRATRRLADLVASCTRPGGPSRRRGR